MFNTWKTQRELAAVYAPCGQETQLAGHISQLAKPFADECRTDALGNLIIRKKGPGKRVMLSAPMDSPALAATHIDENGLIRFCAVGAMRDACFCAVAFSSGVTGVVGGKADDQHIDIGAANREEAQKLVRVGDMAVFRAETYLSGGGRLVSPCLDGRIGCVVLLQVLSMVREPENDLYFVFTVHHQAGARGAKTTAYQVEPEFALAVGATGAEDVPVSGEERKAVSPVRLGGGAAVKIRDKSLVAHPDVVKWLESAASGIPIQRDISGHSGTGAGAAHLSRGGVRSGAVSVPVRYSHTVAEMADLSDIEACTRLILAAVSGKEGHTCQIP